MKRAHEAHVATGRRIVVSPSRVLWDGSQGWARCSCLWSCQYTAEEKIADRCPRCGERLIPHDA